MNIITSALCFFLLTAKLMAHDSVHDPIVLKAYLDEFPYGNYQVYCVEQQGCFYVEPFLHDTIKNVLRQGNIWEPHLIPLINRYAKEGSTVLDLGAHIGTFTISMARQVGKNGIVHAFEPQKKIFRELYHNCLLNGVENNVCCHRIAIGDKEGYVQMDKETYPGSEGSTGIGQGGDEAKMQTIDSFHFQNVSFIKIDVERSEEQVLDGMVQTILENRPVIVIELQGGYIWETAPIEIKEKIRNSMDKLTVLGYSIERIHWHDYLALPMNLN